MKSKLLYGVGIYDGGCSRKYIECKRDLDGKRKRQIVWECPYYKRWYDMLKRCYSESYQKRFTTYIGCTVDESWFRFSNFKAWVETQDWENKELDKDLLVKGNTVYSESTCCFLEPKVNYFIIENSNSSNQFLIGAYFHKRQKKFTSNCKCQITNKLKYLGYFDTELEAHEAWLAFKLTQAKLLASEISDKKIAEALVNRYQNYELPCK